MQKTKRSVKSLFTARNISYLAVLTALTIVLQIWGGTIKIGPTSISLVLVPIVLGGVMLGIWAGAFLGFVFGFIVLMYGVSGADVFTSMLLNVHPLITTLLCLVKGTAAGCVAGLLYKLIAKKNKYVAVFVAAAAAPIVNTGIFILGGLCMSDVFSGFATENDYSNTFYYLVLGVAGWNFVVEFALNLLLSPAIYTVDRVVEKQFVKGKKNYKVSVNEPKTEQTNLVNINYSDERADSAESNNDNLS